jgi:hypothetical protein
VTVQELALALLALPTEVQDYVVGSYVYGDPWPLSDRSLFEVREEEKMVIL